MDWLEVPNFGIEKFTTVKDVDSLEFRPSSTSLDLKYSITEMYKEKLEQDTMIKSKSLVEYIDSANKYKKIVVRPVEKVKDTDWFDSEKPQTLFSPINSYKGDISIGEKIALPVDISLYSDEIDFNNRNELHWSTSGGFACDSDKRTAISKGMSELVENHLKMLWWFNETPIYLLNAEDNVAFSNLQGQSIVKKVRVFLLSLPEEIGSCVVMCVLETESFPFVSVGFGAHITINKAITHAVLESIHYFRGSNWYKMLGEDPSIYTRKNQDVLSLIKSTTKYTVSKYSNKVINFNTLTNNYTFLGKILLETPQLTVAKIFSPDLQPIVNSEYVPFFYLA